MFEMSLRGQIFDQLVGIDAIHFQSFQQRHILFRESKQYIEVPDE